MGEEDWSDDERSACRTSSCRRSAPVPPSAKKASPPKGLGRDTYRAILDELDYNRRGATPEPPGVEYVDYEYEGAGRAAGAAFDPSLARAAGYRGAAASRPPPAAEAAQWLEPDAPSAEDDEGLAAGGAAGGCDEGPEPYLPPKHRLQAYT